MSDDLTLNDVLPGSTYSVSMSDCCIPGVTFTSKVHSIDVDEDGNTVTVVWQNGVEFDQCSDWHRVHVEAVES